MSKEWTAKKRKQIDMVKGLEPEERLDIVKAVALKVKLSQDQFMTFKENAQKVMDKLKVLKNPVLRNSLEYLYSY